MENHNGATTWSPIRSFPGSSKRTDCCTIHPNIWPIILPKLVNRYCQQKCLLQRMSYRRSLSIFSPQMSKDDAVDHIFKLKNKTSCGFVGISPTNLKMSTPYIVEFPTYLYSLYLDKCYFQVGFRHAKIIPLHKKGNLNDINNFRPVSFFPPSQNHLNIIYTHVDHKWGKTSVY